jgi:hypothetical protein
MTWKILGGGGKMRHQFFASVQDREGEDRISLSGKGVDGPTRSYAYGGGKKIKTP